MTSEKQVRANRLNGLKGGVKTPAGKAVSRLNAVSHGFYSNEIVLPGENYKLLARLRQRCLAELQPQGELENLLVERYISLSWRLKRLMNLERRQQETTRADYRYTSWQNQQRYEITLERQMYKALHELKSLQKDRLEASRETSSESLTSASA